MEKRAIIEPGLTPPENEEDTSDTNVKSASVEELDNDPIKRLSSVLAKDKPQRGV